MWHFRCTVNKTGNRIKNEREKKKEREREINKRRGGRREITNV